MKPREKLPLSQLLLEKDVLSISEDDIKAQSDNLLKESKVDEQQTLIDFNRGIFCTFINGKSVYDIMKSEYDLAEFKEDYLKTDDGSINFKNSKTIENFIKRHLVPDKLPEKVKNKLIEYFNTHLNQAHLYKTNLFFIYEKANDNSIAMGGPTLNFKGHPGTRFEINVGDDQVYLKNTIVISDLMSTNDADIRERFSDGIFQLKEQLTLIRQDNQSYVLSPLLDKLSVEVGAGFQLKSTIVKDLNQFFKKLHDDFSSLKPGFFSKNNEAEWSLYNKITEPLKKWSEEIKQSTSLVDLRRKVDEFKAELKGSYDAYTKFVADYAAHKKNATSGQVDRLSNMAKFLGMLDKHMDDISELQPKAKEERKESGMIIKSRNLG